MPLFPFSRMRKRTWIRIVKAGSFKGGRQFIGNPPWGAPAYGPGPKGAGEGSGKPASLTGRTPPGKRSSCDGRALPSLFPATFSFPRHFRRRGRGEKMGVRVRLLKEGERIMRFSKAWPSGAHYPAVSRGGDFPPFPRQRRRGRYSSPFTPFHASSPRYAGSAGSPGRLPELLGGMARQSLSGPRASPRVNGRGRETGVFPPQRRQGTPALATGLFSALSAPPSWIRLRRQPASNTPSGSPLLLAKWPGSGRAVPADIPSPLRTREGSGPIHRDSGCFF